MKYLLLIICFVVSACGESKAQIEQRELNNQLRLKAWQACIDSGGAPIASWIGTPSMRRCEYREKANG